MKEMADAKKLADARKDGIRDHPAHVVAAGKSVLGSKWGGSESWAVREQMVLLTTTSLNKW